MKIEKNVVIPPKARFTNKGRKFSVFHQMEVGDSVFFPNRKGVKPSTIANRCASNARALTKHRFATRIVEGGVRLWRVE